jgi:UDP:flavonoid glycosyltransferase YjiC (YdhE family)
MRALFTSTPYWGHVNPMLPLARAFLARGDEVLWATPVEACDRLASEGIVARVAGRMGDAKPGPAFLARSPDVAALPLAEQADHVFPAIFGIDRTGPMLADLLPIVEDWRPDLVVREVAEFAAPIAAARAGIPCVTHAFGAIPPARRTAAAGDSVAPLWEAHGLAPRPHGGSYDHLYLDIYPASLPQAGRGHVTATQPLGPVGQSTTGRAGCLDAADDRPVVYVTLGTVFNPAGTLRELVAGVRDLDVFAVVTTGPDEDVAALGPQPDNVHVARFIPQHELLPHCAAVVSHAGSGTFLATLAAGLPQLLVPRGADQHLNADACVAAGAGIVVEPDAGVVREELARLLTDGSFRAVAEQIGADLAAMPTPVAVADHLAHAYG